MCIQMEHHSKINNIYVIYVCIAISVLVNHIIWFYLFLFWLNKYNIKSLQNCLTNGTNSSLKGQKKEITTWLVNEYEH